MTQRDDNFDPKDLRVSYDAGCLRSLKKCPSAVVSRFLDMQMKVMSDPSRPGLNIEAVRGARDQGIKSVRIDKGYRAIAFQSGRDLLFLHVNEHDKSYEWATKRAVRVDPDTRRIRIVEAIEETELVERQPAQPPRQPGLFDRFADDLLLGLGVMAPEIARIRQIVEEADLDAAADHLDATTHDILMALAMGYSADEIPQLLGAEADEPDDAERGEVNFATALHSPGSQQTIFIPEDEVELRRFFEGDLDGWRVFLHPQQRKLAYRDYNGPALVRGGAGTGKTVVAMHRAKYLADQIAADKARTGERVLMTTFTGNLARDIEANLSTLCPEHLEKGNPRIEVINLDRWVSQFLKRRNFDRRIAYFGRDQQELDDLWMEVIDRASIPPGLTPEFIRSEWRQVVQAQGLLDQRSYFTASRKGRGTPLDRRKRAALWPIFEAYRSRLVDEGLAEPDDAFREAIALLETEGSNLPYSAVVVDEAQDMGELAFRLIRRIVPTGADGDRNTVFIVGDAHQRIYSRRASLSQCGLEVRGRSRRLRLNYRTTENIRRWATAVVEGVEVDDLDDGLDSLKGYRSLLQGPAPELIGYPNRREELDALVTWIRTIETESDARHIGVLCRTLRNVQAIRDYLKDQGLETLVLDGNTVDSPEIPGVRVATMHRAKGLEFEAVAMAGLRDDGLPPKPALGEAVDAASRREVFEREKALLHVAATRAKRVLRVTWTGPQPNLIPTSTAQADSKQG